MTPPEHVLAGGTSTTQGEEVERPSPLGCEVDPEPPRGPRAAHGPRLVGEGAIYLCSMPAFTSMLPVVVTREPAYPLLIHRDGEGPSQQEFSKGYRSRG